MINNLKQEDKVALMQRLINFGKVEEGKSNLTTPIVEYKKAAANGKTYGIVREANKFYIMEAPQKDTEVLAEDFQYIGGINNRRENEYSSYAKASNALDLKIMSINETVEKSKRVSVDVEMPKAEWETSITESMRKEIDRFKSIANNASKLDRWQSLNEGSEVPSAHTLPEAPAKNPSDKKVNAPFTDTAVANGDKDFKTQSNDHVKSGKPFNEDGEVTSKDMESDKKPNVKTDAVYTKKAEFVPDNSVADKNPSGGKVVRVNENNGGKTRLKLTLEQVLAWNDNKDLLDTSKGTQIGSSAPFTDELGKESNQTEAPTEPIHEDVDVMHTSQDQNTPTPGTNEVGDTAPYDNKVNEDIVDVEDAAGMPDEEKEDFSEYPFPDVAEQDAAEGDTEDFETDDFSVDEVPNQDDEQEFEIDLESEPSAEQLKDPKLMRGLENWETEWNKGIGSDSDDYDDYPFEFESRRRSGRRLSEDKLNVFGKHPAYRKTPMTLPPNKEVAINGAREWDDESAQGEEPFGKQIGDSAPFDEVVDKITESIMKQYFGNKKKV